MAEGEGLVVNNGIVVEKFCRTSGPLIFAAGDCAFQAETIAGKAIRQENGGYAQNHAIAAAENLLGKIAPYIETR